MLSTIKAISLPIGDTITDLFLIYEYYNEDRPDRAKTLLTIFFISHIICCAVIFQRLRKQEAKAVWCSRPRQILFTFATVFTLGPVVLKLVEIYGEEDRVHGARKPTCYSKLTLCFLECIPQVVLNTFYICSDGCFCANQIISLSLSIAAACYAVQRVRTRDRFFSYLYHRCQNKRLLSLVASHFRDEKLTHEMYKVHFRDVTLNIYLISIL